MAAATTWYYLPVKCIYVFLLAILYIKNIEGSDVDEVCGLNLRVRGFSGPRVVSTSDGDTGPPGSWPWMISAGSVGRDGSWMHQCGGTLVSPKFVLTAAHCAFNDDWLLRLGDRDLDTDFDDANMIIRKIKSKHIHPKFVYDLSAYYDVAIWELDEDVPFTTFHSPICLPGAPSSQVNKYDGYQVTVLGWGLQTSFGGRKNNVLKQTPVKIFSNSYCNRTHVNLDSSLQFRADTSIPKLFQDHLMCAGYELGNFGSCQGDSGGPIVQLITTPPKLRYVQVGIVQGGVGDCGDSKYPGIYTRIEDPEIMEFIEKIINPFSSFPAVRDHLFDGAERGNLSLVRNAIEEGFSPNVFDPSSSLTPLMIACDNEHLGIVEYLIRHGADVNAHPQCYPCGAHTPLSRAAKTGNVAIVRTLIKAGANLTYQDADYRTALTTACDNERIEVVQYLLNEGADIDHTTYFGTTCISVAINQNSTDMVELLIKSGASNIDRDLALINAVTSGNLRILQQIIGTGLFGDSVTGNSRYIDEPTNSVGYNALYIAIQAGRLDMVKFLIESGAKLDQSFKNYPMAFAPIYVAAQYGRYEIIKFLVEAGIDPNIQTEDDTHATPFRYACLAGEEDYDTIKYLLEQGADINEVSAAGSTCLSAAVARDDEKVVKLLKEWEAYGDEQADVNTRTHQRSKLVLCPSSTLNLVELISSFQRTLPITFHYFWKTEGLK